MSVPQGAILENARRQSIVKGALVGVALTYVVFLLVAPLGGILYTALRPGVSVFRSTFSDPRVQHAYYLTAMVAAITVVVTAVFGVITAWVLTRDRFPGRALLNGIVDLPFAVSPVTVGLMTVLLFAQGGWLEPVFLSRGIQIVFALPSMVLVTIFISIPFVIRSVAPVLNELGTDEEEAAQTLGASPLRTFFKVTLKNVRWALAYGVGLSTARALGEVGAVLIVSGSIENRTETATLYILSAIEERLEASGYLVALSLAAVSVVILVGIEIFKHRQTKEQVS
jgi:sulfate/thiosulfate transport system permease protein